MWACISLFVEVFIEFVEEIPLDIPIISHVS
jgi:hypothetical protein